ncbi:hypothetical protein TraAM80_02975, partial [Trypanosoma rangeli]
PLYDCSVCTGPTHLHPLNWPRVHDLGYHPDRFLPGSSSPPRLQRFLTFGVAGDPERVKCPYRLQVHHVLGGLCVMWETAGAAQAVALLSGRSFRSQRLGQPEMRRVPCPSGRAAPVGEFGFSPRSCSEARWGRACGVGMVMASKRNARYCVGRLGG